MGMLFPLAPKDLQVGILDPFGTLRDLLSGYLGGEGCLIRAHTIIMLILIIIIITIIITIVIIIIIIIIIIQ